MTDSRKLTWSILQSCRCWNVIKIVFFCTFSLVLFGRWWNFSVLLVFDISLLRISLAGLAALASQLHIEINTIFCQKNTSKIYWKFENESIRMKCIQQRFDLEKKNEMSLFLLLLKQLHTQGKREWGAKNVFFFLVCQIKVRKTFGTTWSCCRWSAETPLR